MASVGRGRGRGRGFLSKEQVEEAVARPGGGASGDRKAEENGLSATSAQVKKEKPSMSRQESVSDIQHILDNLTLDISDEDMDNIVRLADNAACEDESLKKMTEIVYEKCVSDREFAKTGAFICDKLSTLETNGTKFRSLLLSMIQSDYKEKDALRSKSTSKFLNVVSFMCQVFGMMRTAGGEVFKPLVTPLYECFNVILDSTDCNSDEYECLNEQMQSVGRDLEQNDRDKMEAFMDKIRSKIIRNGSTPQMRCTLLEIVECQCHGWKNLSNNVTRFYCDTMMDILTD